MKRTQEKGGREREKERWRKRKTEVWFRLHIQVGGTTCLALPKEDGAISIPAWSQNLLMGLNVPRTTWEKGHNLE
jgi:hypothetical protein